jgi:hypothetical protein
MGTSGSGADNTNFVNKADILLPNSFNPFFLGFSAVSKD